MIHIEEVIRLEGGNEYQEGRLKGKPKNRVQSVPQSLRHFLVCENGICSQTLKLETTQYSSYIVIYT
jgi:hypothetical protein